MHRLAQVCKFSTIISSQTLIWPFFFSLRKVKCKKILHSGGGVSVGLVPYLTICLPRGLHLLMENPPHPGSLCLTASLCPPGLWLSSPVIAQGFVLCTLADTFMPSLPHHPAQSQTHTQWAAFPGFISDLSSCSPCLAQDSLSTHLATSWYSQWWNYLPAHTPHSSQFTLSAPGTAWNRN